MITARKLAIPLAAAAALLVPSTAGATTFCVHSPTCVANGGTNEGGDAAALQKALDDAENLAGKDRVVIGASSFSRDGGFSYDVGGLDNPVQIDGAGSDKTVLKNLTSGQTLHVGGSGSSVSDLKVVVAPSAVGTGLFIVGPNTSAKGIAVRGQAGTTNSTGLSTGGTTVSNADVQSTAGQLLVGITGSGRVFDSKVTMTSFGYGIYGPQTIQRTTILGAGVGILANGGRIDNVRMTVPGGGKGLVAASTASTNASVTADHLTITGGSDHTSIGANAEAMSGPFNPHNATLVIRSSIVRRVGHPLGVSASNGGAANVQVDHSDVNLGASKIDLQSPDSTGAVSDMGSNLHVDPLFVGSGDFHLQSGSPAIDKGRATVQPNESPTDLDDAARLFGPATDMGAYEWHP
jgi:hypothetical protein